MNSFLPSGRLHWLRYGCGCLLVLGLLNQGQTWGQDAFRASLAGQVAAELKKQRLENQRFNVLLGPVSLRLSEQLGVEFTDNVRSAPADDAEADCIIRPRQNITASWRVTEKNSLDLSLGIGYEKYVRNNQYDSFFVSPDSDLSFDLYVKDIILNFHSRFSYVQDVVSDPSISGVATLSRFQNTSGVGATWDLNRVILTAEYNHEIFLPTDARYSQYARSSELGTVSAGYQIQPSIFTGLAIGGGLTDYDEETQVGNTYYSVGPYITARPSQYLNARLSGGNVSYFIDTSPTTELNAFYFDFMFRQQVTPSLAHSLSVGRQLQSGIFANTTDQLYARYSANWHLFRKTSTLISLSYQKLSYKNYTQASIIEQDADFYSFGMTFSRPLTRHLSGSLAYSYYLKESDVQGYEYFRNQLALNLIYAF